MCPAVLGSWHGTRFPLSLSDRLFNDVKYRASIQPSLFLISSVWTNYLFHFLSRSISLSSIFLLIITGVGFLIHLYSTCIHARREQGDAFCAIFLLPQSVRFFHAVAGDGCQLRDHVYRMGRSWPMFLPADRILVQEHSIITTRRRRHLS